jgi:hypothetical protein
MEDGVVGSLVRVCCQIQKTSHGHGEGGSKDPGLQQESHHALHVLVSFLHAPAAVLLLLTR